MIDLFGDESGSEDHASYAVVMTPSDVAADIGAVVTSLKAEKGLEVLHCRVLFSPNQREKMGLGHLSTPDVIAIYESLAERLERLRLRIVTARVRLSDFPTPQPAAAPFPRFIFDSKTMGIMCANATLIPILQRFSPSEIRFWPDQDTTKAEFLGQRVQPHGVMGGYYGIEGVRDVRVSPTPLADLPQDDRGALFEVADLAAWLSNRMATGKNSSLHPRLSKLFRRLYPMEVKGVRWEDGGLSFTAPADWPERPNGGTERG